ncbi:MAG: 30S ribosomal protein S9 [Planctomycetota bacterium]
MAVANPYTWGLGRRKSAVARVRIKPGTGNFLVNGKPMTDYFTTVRDQKLARLSLLAQEGLDSTYDIWVNVRGGGPHGQAGAVQLGVARALKEANPVLMESLREGGLLTRDPRMKERKKYGRRGARRGFQFSKR